MRTAQLIIVLGTNGTGKTTYIKKTINHIKYTDRKLIVTPDPMEWTELQEIKANELNTFKGTKRIVYYDGLMALLSQKIVNCVVVFDDFKAFFITKLSEVNAVRSLCIRRRQRMLDIFIAAHGFTEITPTYLYTFASKLIIFRTTDNFSRIKNRFKDYEKVALAAYYVNSSKLEHYYRIIKN